MRKEGKKEILGHNPSTRQGGIQAKEHSESQCPNVQFTGKTEIPQQ